ncbi:MAG: M23 family metallopeptidase [Saprospiraceae bacterium]|nr:M23 family metallopeptidase [Saprospiraceae bacterium]
MNKMMVLFLLALTLVTVRAAIPVNETNFICPVNYGVRLAGSFGELRGRHFHAGLDIKSSNGRTGDSIFCAETGYISRIRIQRGGYGKVLYVSHPNGYTTVYAHLDGFNEAVEKYVSELQNEMQSFELDILPESARFPVTKRNHLAFLGNTGISYGPHLHFEIRETAKDKAINPLLFGIKAVDRTPPVFTSISVTGLRPDFHAIYSRNYDFRSKSNRKKAVLDWEVPAWRAGISVAAFDHMDRSHNKQGLYRLELFVDDTLFYKVDYDSFSFQETHLIDAHTHFDVDRKNYRTEVLCYRVPGNELSMINTASNKGLISLYKDRWRHIKVVISDYEGNTSVQQLRLKRAEIRPNVEDTKINIKQGMVQEFRHKNLQVIFSPQSLARDIGFNVTSGGEQEESVFEIGQEKEPILSPIRLAVKIPESLRPFSARLGFMRKSGQRQISYGQVLSGDSLVVYTSEFGRYGFYLDTVGPQIIPTHFRKRGNATTFKFKIRDNVQVAPGGSPFQYDVWIDEAWMACEFRDLNATLSIPVHHLRTGNHQLRIEARDQFGNISTWNSDFVLTP